MNDNPDTLSEREEIEMLLPWYVTGKLDRADASRVEAYLAREPAMSHQLSLIRNEREQTIVANEAIAAPPAGAVARLMAEVQKPSAAGVWRELMARLEAFFAAPPAGAVRWAAAAAAVLIVVQAAAIGTLLSTQSDTAYETASGRAGSAAAGDGTFALVRFADGATAKELSDILAELQFAIVEGPKPGNLYRVRLGPKDMTEADRDHRIARLRQRGDLVSIVMPAQ